jgi:hypothetical protein
LSSSIGNNGTGNNHKLYGEDGSKRDGLGCVDALDNILNGTGGGLSKTSNISTQLNLGSSLMDSLMGYKDSSEQDVYSLFPSAAISSKTLVIE